jgi:hypothetical protein
VLGPTRVGVALSRFGGNYVFQKTWKGDDWAAPPRGVSWGFFFYALLQSDAEAWRKRRGKERRTRPATLAVKETLLFGVIDCVSCTMRVAAIVLERRLYLEANMWSGQAEVEANDSVLQAELVFDWAGLPHDIKWYFMRHWPWETRLSVMRCSRGSLELFLDACTGGAAEIASLLQLCLDRTRFEPRDPVLGLAVKELERRLGLQLHGKLSRNRS